MSEQFSLDKQDWKKWRNDSLYFFGGVVLVYLGQLTAALQTPFHVFRVEDLIPSTFTWGGIVAYFANTIQNLMRKFANN